jgi:hypothetical protein
MAGGVTARFLSDVPEGGRTPSARGHIPPYVGGWGQMPSALTEMVMLGVDQLINGTFAITMLPTVNGYARFTLFHLSYHKGVKR